MGIKKTIQYCLQIIFLSANCTEIEFKEKNEQTSYERLVSSFPNIQLILEKNKITKDDINSSGFKALGLTVFFKKDEKLVIITKNVSNDEYNIKIL